MFKSGKTGHVVRCGISATKKLTFSIGLCGVLTICGYLTYFQEPLYFFVHSDINSQCILPDIDPFDQSIMKYYNWHPPPLICDSTPSLTLVDDSGNLVLNPNVYNSSSKHGNLSCFYSVVDLIDDFNIKFQQEVYFKPPYDVQSDAFIVKCKDNSGKIVYENVHQKIDRKSVEKVKARHFQDESDGDVSVLMFGIDSVSRLAAIRKLPKTIKYLKENLNAYIFNGFNKVGDHTFPNLLALMCGKTQFGFKNVDIETDYADKYPFIWKEFENNGYVTMHAEDWPEIATFNQVMKAGFEKPPTIHYGRPFWLAMRKIQPMQFTIDQVLIYLESKAMKLRKSSGMCYGNRPNHMLVIDHYKQFLQAYRGKRKFAFGWLNELAHNYVNFLEYGDNDFMEFIKWMHLEKHLDNSILIFFSDHGSRLDEIRNTYIGRIEDRMPLFSIVIPEVLRQKYPELAENLKSNQFKLTSTFDAHETLRDLLYKRYSNWTVTQSRDQIRESRPVSLFQQIPNDRSCADARIPEEYCACYSSQPINKTESLVQEMGKFVVEKIYEILRPVRSKCAVPRLDSILEARRIENSLERKADKELKFTLRNWLFSPEQRNDQKYLITLRTMPGNASFEATLIHSSDGALSVLGDISRTNRYGNQSACLSDRYLRNYCFCV